jgi:hypothetical protein
MTEESMGIKAIDSLSANEFQVEIDGEVATGIFGVSGLCVRSMDLTAGRLVHLPLTISKMVQQDPDLACNRWTRETLANPTAKVTRQVAVVAIDEGVETRRWSCGCVDQRDRFSGFDRQRRLVEERLTLQHSGVEEIWP